MSGILRIVVEDGPRAARAHLSMTEALRRRHAQGRSPDTFRFQSFEPSAIVGRHQHLAREVDLDWCRAHGVATARRMTGGGAIVMGPGLLGWELIVSRRRVPASLEATSALLCEGVARGLSRLGCAAAFRPRNDIEVEGRKLSGTGGYFEGATLVFQGTVLIDLDPALMIGALRPPAAKLGKRGLEAFAARVVDLKTLLGAPPGVATVAAELSASVTARLGLAPQAGALDAEEEALARAVHDEEIGVDAFVEGRDDRFAGPGRVVTHRVETGGGTLDIALKLRDGDATRVERATLAGDFFVTPPRLVADLEARLRDCATARLAQEARAFLDAAQARFLGLSGEEVVAALAQAARKATDATQGGER